VLLLDSSFAPIFVWRCALTSFRYRAPKTDDEFEEFCLALYQAYLKMPGLKRYGRRGQRQHGIDIIDLESPPPHVAIQCKAEDLEAVYTEKSLRAEVDKALTAPFKLKRYIVLTTSKTSTELQIAISQINAEHMEIGQFIVEFKGWEEIERVLDQHPEVAQDKLTTITNTQLVAVNDNLAGIASAVAEVKSTVTNNRFDGEISEAKEEIERRDFALAKQKLSRLRRDKWDNLTDEQRFLVIANLGHIEAAKNLAKPASALLFQSIQYAKGTMKNREVEAQAYALRNEHEKAFELASALKIDHPESWKATMLLIHSAPLSEKLDDLIARAFNSDLVRQEVCITIAMRALSARLYETGRKYAQDAIDSSDTPWPISKITLAQCTSHDVLLGSGAKPIEGFSETDRKLLKEADDLFKEGIACALERDENYIAAQAMMERAGITERLGDEKGARLLVEDAYRLAPDEPNTQAGYALLQHRLGDTDRAISIMEQTPYTGPGGGGLKRQFAGFLLSRARNDDEQRAADLLKEICLLDEPLSQDFRYTTFAETLGVLAKLGRISEGQALIDAATSQMLSSVARSALTARLFWLMKDNVSANTCLETAVAAISGDSVDTEIELMAATYTAIGEYRHALGLWRRVAGVHNPLATHQAMVCAQRLGDHATVLDLSREVREAGAATEESTQAEVDLLLEDDFEGAIAILKSFLERHPDNAVIRLRISYVAIQHARPDLLQRPEDALPDAATVTPYFARAVTYFLKYTKRHEEALRYGYDVLHRYFDDVDAHRAYMLLFAPLGPPIEIATPDKAGPGCAVEYLEHGTDIFRWHVIEDVLKPDSKLNEFAPDHPISQALLGKVAGDVVPLAPGRISERPATIRQVLNKYVYRYQCCVNELQLRFPEATELQSMQLPRQPDGEFDLTDLRTKMEQQLLGKRQAIQGYSAQALPLHFVGEILGASSFEAVLHLANDPKSIVRCAPENQQQRVFAAMGLSAAAEIVLDLSAIATLFLCDAMDLLTKLNLPIIISQGCAEEIDRITGKTHDGSPRAGLRIGWQDEQMVGFEVTEQQHAERDQHFAKQLEKVRAIAVIEPCRELSAMAEETKKPLIAIFGRYGTQAILLAKKPGRVLWSDDFVQSSIAIKEYGVRVAWTELVVANLESKGLLSRKDAVAAVTTMLGHRYEVVTITPAIFVESARRASFDKSVSPFSHALVPFINLRITENIFAIIGGIASETIREVADNKERAIVIRSLLETIAARRDGIRVLGLISRVFQGAQLPWRNEWVPIINDVMTSAAIDFINKVNP
jgi:tetratricopeptide (TPR) repeat protein